MITTSTQVVKSMRKATAGQMQIMRGQRIVLVWDLDLFYDKEKHYKRQLARQRISRFPEEYQVESFLEDPERDP